MILTVALLASGMAGLVFEVVWFRQLSWIVGGTVWAASAVLAAFMAGLCMGYWISTRLELGPRAALRACVIAELVIGVSGAALVLLLPLLPPTVAAILPLADLDPGAAQILRFMLAFILMVVPTTAMGVTLPLLASALVRRPATTAGGVGWLYGINTLGACAGVLGAEFVLIPEAGIARTGALAALGNLTATLLILTLVRGADTSAPPHSPPDPQADHSWSLAWLAGIAGAVMLGFEVVGFRLLLLHLRGSSEVFAVMLAVVLLGIAVGGMLIGLGERFMRSLPESAGVRLLLSPALLALLLGPALLVGLWILPATGGAVWLLAGLLFLPAALLSGMLLPAISGLLVRPAGQPGRAAGQAFLANTGGAALGALIAGLLLLPAVGVVNSLILLAALSVAAAVVTLWPLIRIRAFGPLVALLAIAATGLTYWRAPALWQAHADVPLKPFVENGEYRVDLKEGVNETAQLLRRDFLGEPIAWRLVTNAHSMSNTESDSRRYMKLFVWLPMLFSDAIRDVLLISYGTGATASALTGDPEPEHIDVVDPSRDVLALSPQIHGQADPLSDPRVQIHLEDGRNYLLSTTRRYDLITGEPPPPRLAGIVNLYTAEYFALMHSRLKPGGWASYWLPVDQLTQESGQAIVRAFCNSFHDCSLWAGSNYNWILLGSAGVSGPVAPQRVVRLWQGEQRRELVTLGLEHPALLGAAFLADARQLQAWSGQAQPLVDVFPGRLNAEEPNEGDLEEWLAFSDPDAARQRFLESNWLRRRWPAGMRNSGIAAFDLQPILNNEINVARRPWLAAALARRLLEEGRYRVPVLWLLGSGVSEVDIALNSSAAGAFYHRGLRELVEGNADAALALLAPRGNAPATPAAIVAACAAGKTVQARQWYAQAAQQADAEPLSVKCW